MIIIDLFNILNQLIQPHVVKVFVITLRDIVIRVLRVFLTHDGKNHIVGIKITGRLEVFIAVELHAFTQRESIGLAVW